MSLGVVEVVLLAVGVLALATVGLVLMVRRRRQRDAPLGHMPSGWLEQRATADPVVDADRR